MNSIDKKTEIEYPYTILTVERHNYEVMEKGDWHTIKYDIYFDGSYTITYYTLEDDILNPKYASTETGKLNILKFKRLKNLLDSKNWDNSNREVESEDDIWKIGYFNKEGKLIESIGDTNSIYKDKILNKIINCLPKIKKGDI